MKRRLNVEHSVTAKWCGFVQAEDEIRSFLPNVVVLDILTNAPGGQSSVEGSSVIGEFIWNSRFCLAPSHGPGKQQFRTVRQSIARFPPIPAGGGDPEVLNHVAASVSDLNLQRLQATPHDGGDRRSWPAHLRLQCHSGGYGGHTEVYGRMFWDRPAPALTGRCYSVSNGRYGHPDQDRAISLREAAAIQSFPDRYRFFGSNTDIAKQVGNAVPVRFAECLGRHILFLQRESYLRAA